MFGLFDDDYTKNNDDYTYRFNSLGGVAGILGFAEETYVWMRPLR